MERERRSGLSRVQRQPAGCRRTGFGRAMLALAEAVEPSSLVFERPLETLAGKGSGVGRTSCPEPIVYRITRTALLDRGHARHPGLKVQFVTKDKSLELLEGDAATRWSASTTRCPGARSRNG